MDKVAVELAKHYLGGLAEGIKDDDVHYIEKALRGKSLTLQKYKDIWIELDHK